MCITVIKKLEYRVNIGVYFFFVFFLKDRVEGELRGSIAWFLVVSFLRFGCNGIMLIYKRRKR